MTARVKPRTDDPKPGPFRVGTRLRYKGDKTITMGRSGGEMVTVLNPGIEVTIRTNGGRIGESARSSRGATSG